MQSVFQVGSHDQPKPKRNRVSLNCISCKRRKIKCDRNKPCGSCVKYGSACEYSEPVWSKADQDKKFSVQRLDARSTSYGEDGGIKKRKTSGEEEMKLKSSGSGHAMGLETGASPAVMSQTESKDGDGVFAQLEFLKSKLHELESKVHNRSGSPVASHTSPPAIEKKPLDWETISSSANNESSSNPTFIGINPFNDTNPGETINFYEGYAPVHVQDLARRYNHGPFAWLTLLKKDPAQSQIWKYLHSVRQENRKRIRQTPRAAQLPPLIHHFRDGVPETGTKAENGCCGENGETKVSETDKNDDDPGTKKKESGQEWEFQERAIDRDGFNDLRLYGNVRTKFKQSGIRDGTSAIATTSKPTGSSEQKSDVKRDTGISPEPEKKSRGAMSFGKGKIEEELNLIENLRDYLPKQKVIWKSIELFFTHLYPFFPLLDEQDFVREMERILGPKDFNDSKITDLKIEKRLDLAYLGALFIIIRFAYVSLVTNRTTLMDKKMANGTDNRQEMDVQYLLLNPAEMKLIEMAELCLDQFNLNRRCALIVLQCTFLLRLYYMFGPEHGDGSDGGDSQVINGLMVQMALAIGLHRDGSVVTNIYDIISDEESIVEEDSAKQQNIHRKIWFFLVICDLIQGYQYGNPLCIRDEMYDTRLPYYVPGNENIGDVEREKHVVSTFAYLEKYRTKLVNILNMCLNLHKPANLQMLTNSISDFEVFLNDNFGIMKLFLIPFDKDNYAYPFLKIMKCKNYINMKFFLNGLLFHLYIHYEAQAKKQNQSSESHVKSQSLAFFYLRKIMVSLYGEFLPNVPQLLWENAKNFGTGVGSDLIINPFIEGMLHKISQFSFAMLTRLNSTIYLMRSDTQAHDANMKSGMSYRLKYGKLVQLSQLLERVCEIVIMSMSRLSQRYYYAWRITKAHTYIMTHCIRNQDFFKLFHEKKQLAPFLECSDAQLNELIAICQKGMKPYARCKKKFGESFSEHFSRDQNQGPLATEYEMVRPANANANVEQRRDNVTEGDINADCGDEYVDAHSHQNSVSSNGASTTTEHSNIMNNPMSSESWSSLDDFNTVSNTDIDNLWISLKMKTSPVAGDGNVDQFQGEFANAANVSASSNTNGSAARPATSGTPFTPSVLTPFWQSLAQPYSQQSQSHQQQQQQQQQNYQQTSGYNGGVANNQDNGAAPGGAELKTLNDFDLFNSLPLEEMLGIASMNLP
ncbi:hypothetical protein KGF57_002514 [Candida theae]|uniref:Zn(2)-C6 fungal-type domain-containing protein n=1 Tax=Candida theae TaxID=1198502 RepID=A0AAD5BFN0_9ASCO|nr:uncharacterized protein KGF57_002514 [Candida theae]KAI5958669.1 hypothetical protein KGF57_002514 [Candida theae]